MFSCVMRLSILSPTTPLRGKGGDMSAFVRHLLINFGPRGGAFEIMLIYTEEYGVVGSGSGLARCLGENRKSSRCEDSSCDRRRS